MRNPLHSFALALSAGLALLLSAGCATHPVPATPAQPAPKITAKIPVKASAYSYGAKCNGAWAKRNAIGGCLQSGAINSAAADWSRFPVGTKFRVAETGKLYIVDDYGSAMVGKDKVDLYMPNYGQVNRWGLRDVTLEILEWGSHDESLTILQPRAHGRYGYVRRMVEQLQAKLRRDSNQRES
jgi:3D (Asp-Asp-Asp) domain-containing protein